MLDDIEGAGQRDGFIFQATGFQGSVDYVLDPTVFVLMQPIRPGSIRTVVSPVSWTAFDWNPLPPPISAKEFRLSGAAC